MLAERPQSPMEVSADEPPPPAKPRRQRRGTRAMSDLVKDESCPPDHPAGASRTSLTPRPEELLVAPTSDGHCGASSTGRSRGPARLVVAVIAAFLVAAVAGGAAALSGGSGASAHAAATASAEGSLASAASNSASATSVAFTLSATEISPSMSSTPVTGSGVYDLAQGVGQVTVSGPSLSPLTGAGSQGSLDIVSDGTDLYVNVPALSSLTGGKSWVETSAVRAGLADRIHRLAPAVRADRPRPGLGPARFAGQHRHQGGDGRLAR